MSIETMLGVVGGIVGILTAVISSLLTYYATKNDLKSYFAKSELNLSGKWNGMSIYLPVDICEADNECIYKFTAQITQKGKKIVFKETIYGFYNIDMKPKDMLPRIVVGSGKMLREQDLFISFNELNSLTCGTMYLRANDKGTELSGIIAVRNPYFPVTAGVKILLRKEGEPLITEKDLNLERVKAMADTFTKKKDTVA